MEVDFSLAEIRELLETLDWQPFDALDYSAFSGVNSDEPKVAYLENLTFILDGDLLEVTDEDMNFEVYDVSDIK